MSNAPAPQPAPQDPKPGRAAPLLLLGGALVVVIGFGAPALLGGADAVPPSPAQSGKVAPEPIAPPSAGSIGLSLLKLVGGLAVMCAACVLAAKYMAPKPATGAQVMSVVAALPVGPCTIHLVRTGDRRLLVGTDSGGAKVVLELPPAPEPTPEPAPPTAEEAPATPTGAPTQTEIIQLLLKLRDRTSAPG